MSETPLNHVDIYVLTHNRPEYLFCCLDALSKYTPMSHRIFVVDNGSATGRNQEVIKMFEHGRGVVSGSLRLEENSLCAREHLIAKYPPAGKYMVIMDDDVIVNVGWLESLCETMEQRPEYGVLSPNLSEIDRPDASNALVGREWLADVNAEPREWREPDGRLMLIWSWKKESGDIVETGCVGVMWITPAALYMRVGRFVVDSYYCGKVREMGLKVGYLKDMFVRHIGWNEYTDYPAHRPEKDAYLRALCKME